MTAELAKVINDGLYFYEQELLEQENKVRLHPLSSCWHVVVYFILVELPLVL